MLARPSTLSSLLALSLIAACGKVVLDGPSSSTGGPSGTGGAGGCQPLVDAFEAALAAATSCTDGAMPNPCQTTAQDFCGCTVLANDAAHAAAAAAAFQVLFEAHCQANCPNPCVPVDVMLAQCAGGMCVEGPG